MIKKTIRKILSIIIIISMIFTSSGVITFANAEAMEDNSAEFLNEESSSEDISEEESSVEIEEESNESEKKFSGEDNNIEEENVEEEAEKEKEIEIEEESIDALHETEEETTIEDDKEEENADAGSQAHPYDTTEETVEEDIIRPEEEIEVEVSESEKPVVDDIVFGEPGAGGGGRVKFEDSTEQIKDRDYTLDGRTEITKVTTTKTVTAPTVTIASSESNKLSFSYWYNAEKNIKFNSGESKALGNNAPSGNLQDGDPYRYFTPVFNDTRPVMSIQIKDQYLGYVVFGYNKRNYGFYEGSENYIIRRKLALTAADYEGLKSGLEISPGYAFSRIVNSSGNEVDPTQWNRSSNVTYYLELKDNKKKIYYRDSKYNSTFSKQEEDVYEGLQYTLPTLVSISYDATNAGQEFLGWKNTSTNEFFEPGVAITFSGEDNITYEAVYSEHPLLEYNLKGHGKTAIDRVELEEGDLLVRPTDPIDDNYNFVGWYHDYDLTNPVNFSTDTISKGIKVIYAKWEEKEFNVILHDNGGTYTAGYQKPTKRKYSEKAVLPAQSNISKTGYHHAGWYANSDFTGYAYTEIPSNTTGDKEYYLKWEENSYTIEFNLNGGSIVSGNTFPTSRLYTEAVTLPDGTKVQKIGSGFDGWYESSDLSGSKMETIPANTARNVVLYAKWVERDYLINYHTNGGAYVSGFNAVTSRKYGNAVTLPTDAQIKKTGFTFKGWYESSSFEGSAITTINSDVIRDCDVYAKWAENEYTISFVLNGAAFTNGYTAPTKRLYSEATPLPTKDNMYLKGNYFKGWFEKEDFSGMAMSNIPANTDSNKTYYAKWTESEYNIIYHEDGGTYVQGYSRINKRKYSEAVTLPNETQIIKDGATFIGWYRNAQFTGDKITSIPANTEEDVHVYMKWDEAEFSITYYENGGVYKSGFTKVTKRRYSDSVVLPQSINISKKGYSFEGWYENEDFSGSRITTIMAKTARDIVVYAKWGYGNYTITYNENGGTYVAGYNKITTRAYADEVILPTKNDLIKDAFELEGWYETPNFKGSMITKIAANTNTDKVLYAKWVGKEYNVTLNVNGGTIKYGNVLKYRHTIGATLPTNVIPPNKNKKFAGWYENEKFTGNAVPRIVPESTGNKTYYAKYTNVYNIEFNAGGGEGTMNTITIDEGKSFTMPSNGFNRSGYKFVGWNSSDNKKYEASKSYTSNTDIVLTAMWEKIESDDTKDDSGSGDTSGGTTGGDSDKGGSQTGGGTSSGGDSQTGGGTSSGGTSTGGNSSSGRTSGGSSSGRTSGGSSRGGSSGGSSSGGGISSGGGSSSIGPGSNGISERATTGPGVGMSQNTTSSTNINGETIPVVPVIPNVGVANADNAYSSNDTAIKEIAKGNAKPGMFFTWEMNNNRWRAKDMVTNDYAKDTFVYVNYAGKLRKYFFDANGDMAIGWINHNGYIYYMNPQVGINYGDMMTGVNMVDGNLCEFLPSGEFYRTIA